MQLPTLLFFSSQHSRVYHDATTPSRIVSSTPTPPEAPAHPPPTACPTQSRLRSCGTHASSSTAPCGPRYNLRSAKRSRLTPPLPAAPSRVPRSRPSRAQSTQLLIALLHETEVHAPSFLPALRTLMATSHPDLVIVPNTRSLPRSRVQALERSCGF